MRFLEFLSELIDAYFWGGFIKNSDYPSGSRKGLLNKPKHKIPYSYYDNKSDFLKELESDKGDEKK